MNWNHCRVLARSACATSSRFFVRKYQSVHLLTERKTERAPKREKAEVPAD